MVSIILFFYASLSANELQKVFNHTLAPHKTNNEIEFGKIVLYFAKEPNIKKSEPIESFSKRGFKEITYFLPNVTIASSEAKQMVAALNKSTHDSYMVAVYSVSKPTNGIMVKITYDPNAIEIRSVTYDAIANKAKVLEFPLYNKKLLNSLEKKGQPILRTAYQEKNPIIIIDCGHGGTDSGAKGFFDTVEKDITLAVGLELSNCLRKNNIPVLLTRSNDSFVALDQRTFIANECPQNAILISLHANSAGRKEVRGVETYCLSDNLFKKYKSDLATAIDVIIDKHSQYRYAHSKRLADCIHSSVLQTITRSGYTTFDRKIRNGAAQVLVGIKWPGVLLEMDFLSNEQSAALLKNQKYQKTVASGINDGIINYLKKTL